MYLGRRWRRQRDEEQDQAALRRARSEFVGAGLKGCGTCGTPNAIQSALCQSCGAHFTSTDRTGLLARLSRTTNNLPVPYDFTEPVFELSNDEVIIPEGVDPHVDALVSKLSELFREIDAKS